MSRSISFFAAFLISIPALALGQVYAPAPILPGTPAAQPTLTQIFNWLDTNHDGYLELDEFLAAPWVTDRAKASAFFVWMDQNKDGLVSLPEFLAAYQAYSGPTGYTLRVTYPFAWYYWRPWVYGWVWHGPGWRLGWAGGWWHGPRPAQGYAVVARGGTATVHVAQANHTAKTIARTGPTQPIKPEHAVKPQHTASPPHAAKQAQPHVANHAAHSTSHAKAGGSHAGHHR
jgi:hypothetical protein